MADEQPLLARQRLPKIQKFAYSVGHVLNDLTASMWFTYMIIYFHQVKNFDNGLSGDLVLIGQVSDAIFTPFIGYESDRVAGCFKMGKRKTWHFIGTVCVMCTFPFLFVDCITCSHSPDWSQFIYYAPFVVIFQFGWASTQINHLSLIPDLTDDADERVGLNGYRYAFTVLSNIIVYAIAWLIFSLGKTSTDTSQLTSADSSKFRLLVLVVVGIGILFSLIFHCGVREKSHLRTSTITENGGVTESSAMNTIEKSTLSRLKMTWKCWLKESQFHQVAVIYMSTRLVVNITQVYLPMYITETIDLDKETIAIIPLIVYVSGFVTSLLMKYVNQAAGRKITYFIGVVFTIGACAFFYFLKTNSKLVYAAAILSGIGGSTMLVTSLAMTADLIGSNTESGAFVYGAMSFTDKLSNGAAIAIIQKFHPCPVGCCPACSLYYRRIVTFVPGGMAVIAVIALATLIPVTLGTRKKKVTALRPINDHRGTAEVDEISYDSDETEALLSGKAGGRADLQVSEPHANPKCGTYVHQQNGSVNQLNGTLNHQCRSLNHHNGSLDGICVKTQGIQVSENSAIGRLSPNEQGFSDEYYSLNYATENEEVTHRTLDTPRLCRSVNSMVDKMSQNDTENGMVDKMSHHDAENSMMDRMSHDTENSMVDKMSEIDTENSMVDKMCQNDTENSMSDKMSQNDTENGMVDKMSHDTENGMVDKMSQNDTDENSMVDKMSQNDIENSSLTETNMNSNKLRKSDQTSVEPVLSPLPCNGTCIDESVNKICAIKDGLDDSVCADHFSGKFTPTQNSTLDTAELHV